MKTISLPLLLFWLCFFVAVIFIVGRLYERTMTLQDDVGDLKGRVNQLEMRNLRHDERWKWISWGGKCLSSVVKHICHRD